MFLVLNISYLRNIISPKNQSFFYQMKGIFLSNTLNGVFGLLCNNNLTYKNRFL